MDENYQEYDSLTKEELNKILNDIDFELENLKIIIEDEKAKFEKYKVSLKKIKLQIENDRRQHNYIPLVFELLKIMSEKNGLEDIYKEAKKEEENKGNKLNKK